MSSSIYADTGTAAHEILESCLIAIYQYGIPISARAYLGQKIEINDQPHAQLSPSGATRWMNCAAAPAMEAVEHGRSEEVVSESRWIDVDEEMVIAVQTALDYIAQRVEEIRSLYGPVTVRTEHRITVEPYIGSRICDGTLDILLIANGYIELADYKHGAGVPVSVEDLQFDIYLLGVLVEYMIDVEKAQSYSAMITVIQPRCEKVEPRIRSRQIVKLEEWLQYFAPKLRAAVEATQQPEPSFAPGEDQCRWCDAKGSCAAHASWAMGRMGIVETSQALDTAARDIRLMTPVEMVQILHAREAITGFLQAVEGYALEQLRKGNAPLELAAAYKLVRSRSNRRWLEEDKEKLLRKLRNIKIPVEGEEKPKVFGKRELTESRLKSPAAVEKLYLAAGMTGLQRRAFDELIEKPEGKLTIAPTADPRDPVDLSPMDPATAFDSVGN